MNTKNAIETLSQATGARTCEVAHITPACITRHADDRLYCHFAGLEQHTKGGLDRDALISQKNEQLLLELIAGIEVDKPIISQVPKNFNTHALRKQYAADLYSELESDTPDSTYHSVMLDKTLDRDAIKGVSKSLGFDEIHFTVTVKNYLTDK